MRRHTVLSVAAGAALALLAAGCGSSKSTGSGSPGSSTSSCPSPSTSKSITVAAFNFPESQILAYIYADVLKKAGYQATVRSLTTREIVEPALWRNQVQVVPEYTSTLTEFINTHDNGPNAAPKASGDLNTTMAALRAEAAKHCITVLNAANASDQNAFAVKSSFATAHHLTKLSDLSSYSGPLVLGGPPECPTRPYCEIGLKNVYHLHITGFRSLDAGGPLTKLALKNGQVQLGLVFTSDPSVAGFGLVVLADDKHLQNVDDVVPVVNNAFAVQAVETALNRVSAILTTSALIQMNAAANNLHADPSTIASAFVTRAGLG